MTLRTQPAYQALSVRAEPHTIWATINRPQQQNAINSEVMDELHAVLDQAERSPDCRMVVLEGSGGVFCTGMDFADASADGAAGDVAARGGEAFLGLLKRFANTPRAIVSRVDGRVSAGGVGLVAASDFVYATPRSTFALPEALWGLLPCCVLPFLIRRTGFQTAYAMTLSTLPITCGRAERDHLVDEMVEDADVAIRRLRLRLTKLDATTISDLKAYLRRMWILSEPMEQAAVAEFGRLMSSPVVQSRIAGFAQHQALPWDTARSTS